MWLSVTVQENSAKPKEFYNTLYTSILRHGGHQPSVAFFLPRNEAVSKLKVPLFIFYLLRYHKRHYPCAVLFLPSSKSINKSFIFKNKSFGFKNKTFIFKNKTFILSFEAAGKTFRNCVVTFLIQPPLIAHWSAFSGPPFHHNPPKHTCSSELEIAPNPPFHRT